MIQTEIVSQIKEIYHKFSQLLQTKIDEDGLTLRLLLLTMRISNNPESNQKELANEMRITQGAMSSSVNQLIKLEMLEQIPMESDMRYNKLMVTQKGQFLIDTHKDYLIDILKNVFFGFNEGELMQLNQLLIRVNDNLSNNDQV